MMTSRRSLAALVLISTLGVSACSSSTSDTPNTTSATASSTSTATETTTAETTTTAASTTAENSDEWGAVGGMGEGSQAFPKSRDGYTLDTEWDSQSRAFEDTVTLIGDETDAEEFTPTMNGCNLTDYLVRWRTVDEDRTVTAYAVDSVGDTHGEVTGSDGWLHLDGCHVPGFEFDSADDDISNLADITVTVQTWRPSA